MADAAAPLIAASGLSKSFGAVRALREVSIEFAAGEVHGLVGANGAGKSTFLNILSGIVSPDEGELRLDGTPHLITDPRHARELGLAFIYQEIALVPEFSAYQNIALGDRAQTPFGMGDGRRRRAAVRRVADRLGLDFDLRRQVRYLTPAERGLVAIARALVWDARFVSMDEPTAALSSVECERLFGIVRELAASGVAVAYVSHRLDEIIDLCDRVTVMKDGAVVGRHVRGGYTADDLILGITGAKSVRDAAIAPPAVAAAKEPMLEVAGLARGPRVADVSFTLHKGEILGLGGVVGSGRTEVLRMLFGADAPQAGAMRLRGRPFLPRTPHDAISAGIGLVPEERRSMALVMPETVVFNTAMGNWGPKRLRRWVPLVALRRARDEARQMVDALAIKTNSIKAVVRTLSGGNQQKVVFGRWISRRSSILLLDEPTRGVDVSARSQIWRIVEDYAAAGNAAIVVCSELQELAVCHRVVVIVEGRSIAVLDGPGVTEERILDTIYSHTAQQKAG